MREKALWEYINICKRAEKAGRRDLIQKYPAYAHMLAGEIYNQISALRNEMSQEVKQ